MPNFQTHTQEKKRERAVHALISPFKTKKSLDSSTNKSNAATETGFSFLRFSPVKCSYEASPEPTAQQSERKTSGTVRKVEEGV